jgi:hypothetical protein
MYRTTGKIMFAYFAAYVFRYQTKRGYGKKSENETVSDTNQQMPVMKTSCGIHLVCVFQ